VCEVPGWGEQLPPARVLDDLRDLGMHATELGPDGWLADGAEQVRAQLDARGLKLAGGFVTCVLHDPALRDAEFTALQRQADRLAAAGSNVLVLAAAAGHEGYEQHMTLDANAWGHLLEGLDVAEQIAASAGLKLAVHPHVGTAIELASDLGRVLLGTEVGLCIDTGHMAIGGIDVVEVVRSFSSRIVHVHLKDVRERLARQVRAGSLGYAEAVKLGLYTPLGAGDARVSDIVMDLESAGYRGWYVLEQDVRWAVGEADPVHDVAASRDLVRSLLQVAAA
jgi:inosose dehydratase